MTPATAQTWVLRPGRARLPDACSPDVRGRSYSVHVELRLPDGRSEGVLISHGDRHAGYALRVVDRRVVHHYVHAGIASTHTSTALLPVGDWCSAELQVRREGEGAVVRLLVDGRLAGGGRLPMLARARIGYTGVDVGCDRGVTVGGYAAPARFAGELRRVTVVAQGDQDLDAVAAMLLESATG